MFTCNKGRGRERLFSPLLWDQMGSKCSPPHLFHSFSSHTTTHRPSIHIYFLLSPFPIYTSLPPGHCLDINLFMTSCPLPPFTHSPLSHSYSFRPMNRFHMCRLLSLSLSLEVPPPRFSFLPGGRPMSRLSASPFVKINLLLAFILLLLFYFRPLNSFF